MQWNIKKIKSELIVIIGFLVISLLYCYPQLGGKQLRQSDVVMWQGMVHEAIAYHDSTGKDVLWSNSMFGGIPTYTTYVGAANLNYEWYIQAVLMAIGKPAYFLSG